MERLTPLRFVLHSHIDNFNSDIGDDMHDEGYTDDEIEQGLRDAEILLRRFIESIDPNL